jgi:hypothetical protein
MGDRIVFLEKPDGNKHLEDLAVNGSMILKRIFKTRKGEAWTGTIWFRIGICGGLF